MFRLSSVLLFVQAQFIFCSANVYTILQKYFIVCLVLSGTYFYVSTVQNIANIAEPEG